MIIGICGKSGSGKGTVCAFFKGIDDDIVHVDIDKIGHKVNELEVVKQKLLMTFGPNVLKDGMIDTNVLKILNKDKEWLLKKLKDKGFNSEKDIFLCILDNNDNLFVVENEIK